jgi:beta-glucosidase
MSKPLVAALVTLAVLVVAAPAGAAQKLPYENSRLPVKQRVNDLLGRMTLEEKVGQMTQAERDTVFTDPTPISALGLGSILSGGGSTPPDNTPEAWADMVDRFQAEALKTRLHIPLIYGVDTVHGHGNLMGATVFPHNIGLGASRDPRLVEEIEHVAAEETRASGPQWAFAPCICAARDDRWGRTYESFSENPKLVEKMETAIDGFQGRDISDTDRVLATAKHYAGDGDTVYDESKAGTGAYPIDQGIDVTTRQDFWRNALQQYVPAIKQHHAGSVMPSYSSVDWIEDGLGNPINMHGNRELIQGFLKDHLDFKGFVISDWEGIHHLPGDYTAQVKLGVDAGIDMFMEPHSAPQFVSTLLGLVNSGAIKEARIDDSVRRILTKKFELGLFEDPLTPRQNMDDIGSAKHHRLARRAAAESQVLLTNHDHTLPIRGHKDVYVAGSNADSMGNQAGGWTITWQGNSNNQIPGTTILDGIQELARGNVTFSKDASAPVPRHATGIVVVGETPYSEGFGDVGGPQWGFDPGENGVLRPPKTMMLSDEDKAAVDKVCAAARRCVMVVVSGRPLIIDKAQRDEIDGLVAAWLPGSEGAGVADTLFGARPFTGRLPMTWPRSLDQEPINVGDRHYNPLFPYGWGLRTG